MRTTLQFPSTRFGSLEIDDDAIIEFPEGLIGLPDRRWTVIPSPEASPFRWLHSLEQPGLALPVTNP